MVSRRKFLRYSGASYLAIAGAPLVKAFSGLDSRKRPNAMRCINVVNFLRGDEPRLKMDLFLPLQKQMETILQYDLPATWLLQYDALVSGPYVDYLKSHKPNDHEVGFWFEMNEMLCNAAKVDWRGRPGYEWDYNPQVAFTIGYSPDERRKLADAAMKGFKSIWGYYPKSIASWNLDSLTLLHLTENYEIDAFAECRDQISTDGFTVWGAPIAGYYPSKVNSWSPALTIADQISTPIFRMLGQDPVYYYDGDFKLPNGEMVRPPDTMEPVWVAGQSPTFVKEFLEMISDSPCLQFSYAQLGQENNFGWPRIAEAYPMQMKALAALRKSGLVHVETMGESGHRFKKKFETTPAQAQVQLNDPFGNTDPAETTIWYQSRFYRANLHFDGNLPYFRDLTVYSDRNPQPYLKTATREDEVEQRMPAVLDGYNWGSGSGKSDPSKVGGFFSVGGFLLLLTGKPRVIEKGETLIVDLPVQDRRVLRVTFDETQIVLKLDSKPQESFELAFEWDPLKSALVGVESNRVSYRFQDFDYSVSLLKGKANQSSMGWTATGTKGEIVLLIAQPS